MLYSILKVAALVFNLILLNQIIETLLNITFFMKMSLFIWSRYVGSERCGGWSETGEVAALTHTINTRAYPNIRLIAQNILSPLPSLPLTIPPPRLPFTCLLHYVFVI